MAFPNVILISISIVILVVCCNVQSRRTHQQQLRPTRGFKEMELAAARNFGKRAVNMQIVNSILMEWIAMESRMRNMQRENLPREVFSSYDSN